MILETSMTNQWIEVFRAGTHTDAAGNEREWTEADLDAIAAGYDPARHEAPVVIGHPADNGPAFGWVEGLKRDGATLLAKLKDVVPEFADMVRKGLYKKRSIALYPDLTLRHLGFLGAQPPAVKGLADIKFKDDGAPVVITCGDFAEPSPEGGHMADDNKIAELQAQLAEKEAAMAAQQAQIEAEKTRAAAFAESEKKALAELALLKREARQQEITAFCEQLVTDNKLPSGLKEQAVAVLEASSTAQEGMQFAEGQKSLADAVKELLAALPKLEFSEQATRDRANGGDKETDPARIAALASEYKETRRRAGTEISFTEAVEHVTSGGN